MSCRCHRRMVSGVTMLARSFRTRRPSFLPFAANRRRWSSVSRSRFPPRCSLKTRFSSRRYSIAACWCWLTQPARMARKSCHGWRTWAIQKFYGRSRTLQGYPLKSRTGKTSGYLASIEFLDSTATADHFTTCRLRNHRSDDPRHPVCRSPRSRRGHRCRHRVHRSRWRCYRWEHPMR